MLDRTAGRREHHAQDFVLRLTPAEWRYLLLDPNFLDAPDNCCHPRRLMGIPVQIVPDHRPYGRPAA